MSTFVVNVDVNWEDLPVKCPLYRKVSLMKLSSFVNFPMLSRVHSRPDSSNTVSISSCRIGTYSGYVARLKMALVISWLVVFTDTALMASCEIPWKWGSFLSGSGTRSLSHSMASFGFL